MRLQIYRNPFRIDDWRNREAVLVSRVAGRHQPLSSKSASRMGKALETYRREFLQKFSGIGALAASAGIFRGDGGSTLSPNSPPARNQTLAQLDSLREQFPALGERVNGHPLVYLDSAASTQRPRAVLDALTSFYLHDNANPAKSLHTLARRSATQYEKARGAVARFLNARGPEEIVWTRGTTEAINLVASSWGGRNLGPGDEIILTVSEHYSSLVPWQLAAKRAAARVRILDVEDDGRLRLDQLHTLLSERTQSVPHFSVDVQELGCDFLAFSGHKMLGPMGIGVLCARREILDHMPPYQAGSNMAHDVEIEPAPTHFAEGGLKFEAGAPNVPGAVGLAAAVEFLESLDRKALWKREQDLTRYALSRLREVKGLRILGPTESKDRISVFSFVMENGRTLEVVKALDAMGIAVRGGDLAGLPLLKRMGVTEAVRASCYAYTTAQEVDLLVAALQEERHGLS